jgi:hypothetical protein
MNTYTDTVTPVDHIEKFPLSRPKAFPGSFTFYLYSPARFRVYTGYVRAILFAESHKAAPAVSQSPGIIPPNGNFHDTHPLKNGANNIGFLDPEGGKSRFFFPVPASVYILAHNLRSCTCFKDTGGSSLWSSPYACSK